MRQLRVRIAVAGGDTGRERRGQRRQMRLGQLHIDRAERFVEAVPPPRADQRHDVVALRRDPGDRDLRRRGADLAGDRAQLLDQRQILRRDSRPGSAG